MKNLPLAYELWYRMNASVLAHTLGLPNADGILPILKGGELVAWYVRDRGILKAGEAW